jgi:C-5 cytosine-specific DNA methylase
MRMEHLRPLAIDLFTGLHGWSEGLVAEGFRVVGFDIEDMCGKFGMPRPEHVQLVIQDVLTLHGSQFKSAALIVASPPCQEFSYMAMPWKRAKYRAAKYRSGELDVKDLTRLFDAAVRIGREAGVPTVIENVRGAQPWVGRSRWNFGSYHLWGDVPALMPMTLRVPMKHGIAHRSDGSTNFHQGKYGQKNSGGSWFMPPDGRKCAAKNNPDGRNDPRDGVKVLAHLNQRNGHRSIAHLTNPAEHIKCGGDWFSEEIAASNSKSSKSSKRKMASAMIAKIPLALARHIARVYRP